MDAAPCASGPGARCPVVGFVDMDCFYVAVERRRDPSLVGLPCAVVQYNSRQAGGAPELPAEANRRVQGGSGGIIAVSYEARQRGVTRQMSSQEARRQCPEVVLVQVPTAFGKADLRIYKSAGDEVVSLLARRAGACEKRSVDEVAIDITAEAERVLTERSWEEDVLPAARRMSHLADSALSRSAASVSRDDTRKGHTGQHEATGADTSGAAEQGGWDWAFFWGEQERRLIAGAVVVAELRMAVQTELGFSCSGGVAQNKMLAKLGCGLHKPNQQTVVLPEAVGHLLRDLPLERLPGLGGDLGQQIKEALAVSTASELAAVPFDRLESAFPRQAAFLHDLAEGRHSEAVANRELCLSLSAAKTFFGSNRLDSAADCERWLGELAGELHRRYCDDLARHNRTPGRVSVHIGTGGRGGRGLQGTAASSSRQMPIDLGRTGTAAQIAAVACACLRRWLPPDARPLGVTSLGMALASFRPLDAPAGTARIDRFFGAAPAARKRGREAAEADVAEKPGPGPLRRLFQQSAAAASQPETGPSESRRDVASVARPMVSFFGPSSSRTSTADDAPIDLEAGDDVPAAVGAAATAEQVGGIDPAVLFELPPAVQAEVLSQLGPGARRELQEKMVMHSTKAKPPLVGRRRGREHGDGGIAAFFRPQSGASMIV